MLHVFSPPDHRARHVLGNLVFAFVALASFSFWIFELRFSLASHDAREKELLTAHQQQQLDRKGEALRDIMMEFHQTARTIALLPELREVRGGNRRSGRDDVVSQGRLSNQTYRVLQQLYANLRAYTSVSEIYFVIDGFAPEKGEVPFFMFDDHEAARDSGLVPDHERPLASQADEEEEYREIMRHLDWFRRHSKMFVYESELDAIPAQMSSLLRTCDTSQLANKKDPGSRDAQGFLYSLPVHDQASGHFKGLVSVVFRANVLEAKLIDVPFLPITPRDRENMSAEGWRLPDPSPFVLSIPRQDVDIFDRRAELPAEGKAGGRWARHEIALPNRETWVLRHYLPDQEVARLAAEIRRDRQMSIAGRLLLLVVLGGFLGWGFWLVRASRHELLKMAHYDQLTDLPNRRLFFENMQSAMARAKRSGTRVGLFFIDLASLNAINDRYGHNGGDVLLTQFANRLRHNVRAGDSLYMGDAFAARRGGDQAFHLSRLGGDEFTILCEGLHSGEDMVVIAEHILASVSTPFELNGDPVEVKLNIGAALYPDDADDPERLLMSADSAMHECKDKSASFTLFNEEMRLRGERLHTLTLELQHALQRDQFELFYQPKATLLNGEVVSMEGLIRWHHPALGMVSPCDFIPILERNGSIVELGEWIVEQACMDLKRLASEGFPAMKLSINVSVHQIKRGNFYDFLKRTLAETGTDPGRMILEITESMVIEDLKKGRDAINELKSLGVSLAIDDFGAGYSSLTYLQHLPLDSLKIDKSLIDGMIDERAVHVVESVIRLAKGLSLKTIAEGIETDAQRELIGRLGCDMMQGYLLSRPQPLSVIIDWLKQRTRPA